MSEDEPGWIGTLKDTINANETGRKLLNLVEYGDDDCTCIFRCKGEVSTGGIWDVLVDFDALRNSAQPTPPPIAQHERGLRLAQGLKWAPQLIAKGYIAEHNLSYIMAEWLHGDPF